MKKEKTNKNAMNVSVALREFFKQYLEKYHHKWGHVIDNFNCFLFVKKLDLDKSLELYKAEWQVKLLLPDIKYIIAAGDKFNFLNTNQKLEEATHILMHIPENANGDILPHHYEGFTEQDFFKKDKNHKPPYEIQGTFQETPDADGLFRSTTKMFENQFKETSEYDEIGVDE